MSGDCPILVAAFGNDMAADDAFGPLVAEALRAMAPAGVEVVNLGMRPAALLDHLAGRAALCVVDAARGAGLAEGTLLDVDFFAADRPPLVHDAALSTHGLSVADELALAQQLGLCPAEVRLIAAIVGSVEVGRPIGAAVRGQVSAAARRVADWAARLARVGEETGN